MRFFPIFIHVRSFFYCSILCLSERRLTTSTFFGTIQSITLCAQCNYHLILFNGLPNSFDECDKWHSQSKVARQLDRRKLTFLQHQSNSWKNSTTKILFHLLRLAVRCDAVKRNKNPMTPNNNCQKNCTFEIEIQQIAIITILQSQLLFNPSSNSQS